MGEDWKVIAYPRREKLDVCGKHDEVLFDGSLAALVLPLAVPRAPKYTKIDLIKELYKPPVRITTKRGLERTYQNLDGTNNISVVEGTPGLSRLPTELLDEVFQYLGIRDLFVLGIQSQSLWDVAQRHIRAMNVSPCGSWAGQRIIGVGNDSALTEVPSTESEEEDLQTGLSEDELCAANDSDEDLFLPPWPTLRPQADVRYQKLRDWECRPSCHFRHLAFNLGEWSRLPANFQSRICEDLDSYDLSTLYPEDQPWILRNLTTQEFVRSEAIALKPEYIHGPRIDILGFGEVVWSFICWSTEDNSSMNSTSGQYRGSWAGDRFDITTLDEHEKESLGTTNWRDVSESIANGIEKIWSRKFGSNWRDVIILGR